MNRKSMGVGVLVVLAIALGLSGCGGDSKGGGGASTAGASGSGPGGRLSGTEREAANAAMAEIGKHWTKTGDGWTTATWEGTSFAPVKFLAQYKDISVDSVDAAPLDESDKMNGIEWAGNVDFKKAPYREVGESGMIKGGMTGVGAMRRRGDWSQWFDSSPEQVQMLKVKGKWQLGRQDYFLMFGKPPTPADYQDAGVKP